MSAQEYLIRIIGEGQSTSTQQTNPTAKTSGMSNTKKVVPTNAGSSKTNAAVLSGGAAAMVAGRSLFNFATSSVAEYTGSQELQANVNQTMKAVGYAVAIKMNPAIGLTVAAADFAISTVQRNRRLMWQEKETEQARQIIGFSTWNRSRE